MTAQAVPGTEVQPATMSYAPGRAATELSLKRTELTLAVQLGLVRTTAGKVPGRWRVARSEIERLRAAMGFPEAMRGRVKLVGTTEAAELMGITRDRFTKLARLGFLVPVKFYLNRYKALVWLYLADDVRQFAEANAALLSGKAPVTLRTRLGAGEDRRARNWRERHCSHLLRLAQGPWEGAAVTASMLDPTQVNDLVPDPYERAYLSRLRPETPVFPGGPDSPTAQAGARVLLADDPEEVRWLCTTLVLGMAEARKQRPAPRPGDAPPLPPTALPHALLPAPTAGTPRHCNTPRGLEPTLMPAPIETRTGLCSSGDHGNRSDYRDRGDRHDQDDRGEHREPRGHGEPRDHGDRIDGGGSSGRIGHRGSHDRVDHRDHGDRLDHRDHRGRIDRRECPTRPGLLRWLSRSNGKSRRPCPP